MANGFHVTAEVIKLHRRNMLTSLASMKSANEDLAEKAQAYKNMISDKVTQGTLKVTSNIEAQIELIKEETEEKLAILEQAAITVENIQNAAAERYNV